MAKVKVMNRAELEKTVEELFNDFQSHCMGYFSSFA
jgi:hypothetical protein